MVLFPWSRPRGLGGAARTAMGHRRRRRRRGAWGGAGGEGRIDWVGIYIGRKRKKDRLGGGDLPRLLLNTSICVYTHMYT